MATQIQTTAGDVYSSCASFIKSNQYNHEGNMDKRVDKARLLRGVMAGVKSETVVLFDIEDADAINFADEE